jgi:hypothetical protein
MSNADAARFLGVGVKTVGHWTSGLRATPPSVYERLAVLAAQQAAAAEAMVAAWPDGQAPASETLETIARSSIWPCEGGAMAVARRAWERLTLEQ